MNPALLRIAELATQLASEVPPDTLRLVASVVAESRDLPDARTKLAQRLAQPHYRRLASRFLDQLDEHGAEASPSELAMSLATAAHAEQSHRSEQSIELVWTGPDVSGMPFRRTEQAILEVLNSAERRITLVSYAVYKIPHICTALVGAAARGVRIHVIVETPDERDGQNEYDALRALGEDVAACSTVYYWPQEQRPVSGHHAGILHVKCVVADSRILFISSANLTEYAFTTNMELGVLIRGGRMPGHIERHFDALISHAILTRPL